MPDHNISIRPHDASRSSVLLRPITFDEFLAIGTLDEEVRRYLPLDEQVPYVHPALAYAHLNMPGVLSWGIEVSDQERTELVGSCLMTGHKNDYPEIGRMIVRANRLSQGSGTLTALGLAAFALDSLDALGVSARTLEVNGRAQASLTKAGFRNITSTLPNPPGLYQYGTGAEVAVMTHWRLFGPEVDLQVELQQGIIDPEVIADSYATFSEQMGGVDVTIDDRLIIL